jgi:hypothetical protein
MRPQSRSSLTQLKDLASKGLRGETDKLGEFLRAGLFDTIDAALAFVASHLIRDDDKLTPEQYDDLLDAWLDLLTEQKFAADIAAL